MNSYFKHTLFTLTLILTNYFSIQGQCISSTPTTNSSIAGWIFAQSFTVPANGCGDFLESATLRKIVSNDSQTATVKLFAGESIDAADLLYTQSGINLPDQIGSFTFLLSGGTGSLAISPNTQYTIYFSFSSTAGWAGANYSGGNPYLGNSFQTTFDMEFSLTTNSSLPASCEEKVANGGQIQANTYTTSTQQDAGIASDDAGNFVVVWVSSGQDGSSWGVYAQRYDNTGATVGSEFLVNTYTTNVQINPTVAMDNDGDFVIIWESNGQDGDSYGIYAQRYDNTGATVGSEFLVNTTTANGQDDAAIAMDGDGDFVITWRDGQNNYILAQRYDNTGATVGSEFQVNTYTLGNMAHPDAAMDDDGNFIITWTSQSAQDGNASGIYGQRYDNTGATVGSEFQINTYTTSHQNSSTVAMDDDGDFVVGWVSSGQDGDGSGVYAQRYDNTGATVGSEFQVNTTTASAQEHPDVAMDDDGNFVFVWHSFHGGVQDVYAQQYNNTGLALGSEFIVNAYTTNGQIDAYVAMDNNCHFVVAWEGYGVGEGSGVFVQGFTDPVPLPVELMDFSARLQEDNTVLLQWQTATEMNNQGFIVQRSVDGQYWEELGFVKGAGTVANIQFYDFVDYQVTEGINYYRLQQIDFDGEYEYSPIAIVENIKDSKSINIYPNPVSSILNISNIDGINHIKIYNKLGQLIEHFSSTTLTSALDLSHLKKGQYILFIQMKNGTALNERMLKQ